MNNWKASVPIMIALVIALVGSAFLYTWLKKQAVPQEVVKVEAEAVPIAVAAVDLPAGSKLAPGMIKTIPFYKESIPNGCFTSPSDLAGRIVVQQLKQGEAIVEHRLAPESVKTGGISAVLKPGKRAIAVKGDKVIGISGFVNPGNNVDILVTLTDPKTKTQKTKLIMENIPVLATGTQIQKNEKGDPAPIDVYTLEVTPEEGEILALAASEGKLQFALRNMMDSEKILTRGTTIPKTLASLSKVDYVKTKKKKVVRRPPTSTSVEIIKGSSMSKKSVRIN